MIKVTKHEQTTIYYDCGCGAKGMCSFKPLDKDAAMVIDLKCPACMQTERVEMLQYKDEDGKQKILDNIENMDLSWSPSFNEEID